MNNFDTSSVRGMGGMFAFTSISTIDISNFNTKNVRHFGVYNVENTDSSNREYLGSMYGMFEGCSALTEIKTGEQWITNNKSDANFMFSGCNAKADLKYEDYEWEDTDKSDNCGDYCGYYCGGDYCG